MKRTVESKIAYFDNGKYKKSEVVNNTIRIDESLPILETLLGGPQHVTDFLSEHFTKHPVVYRNNNIDHIRELLFDLDVHQMLDNTASDKIHVWMKSTVQRQNAPNYEKRKNSKESETYNGTIDSITIEDASQAVKLYRSGHSLYCRVPLDLENLIVPRVLDELGMISSSNDRFRRGEIETFYTRAGHITEFHTDFQENITIMLTGRKKWTFNSSTATSPLRGCSPHFSALHSPDVAEQQLKVNKLIDIDFTPRQYAEESSSQDSVVINPGDVLYHPAGIWHRVECLEDSIAINISLTVASYADVFCCGLQQLLLQHPQWRAPVRIASNTSTEAFDVIQTMMESMPQLLKLLSPQSVLPQPTRLCRSSNQSESSIMVPENVSSDDSHSIVEDSDVAEGENDEDADDSVETVIRVNDIDVEMYYRTHINSTHIDNLTTMKKRKRTESSDMNDSIDFSQLEFVVNPLATILKHEVLHALGGWTPDSVGVKIDGPSSSDHIIIVHSSYGNELYESLSRVAIVATDLTSSAKQSTKGSNCSQLELKSSHGEYGKLFETILNHIQSVSVKRQSFISTLPHPSDQLNVSNILQPITVEMILQMTESQLSSKKQRSINQMHRKNKSSNSDEKKTINPNERRVLQLLFALHSAGALHLLTIAWYYSHGIFWILLTVATSIILILSNPLRVVMRRQDIA